MPRWQSFGRASFGACGAGGGKGGVLGARTTHDVMHGVASTFPKGHQDDWDAKAAGHNGQVWCTNTKKDSFVHQRLSCIAQLF